MSARSKVGAGDQVLTGQQFELSLAPLAPGERRNGRRLKTKNQLGPDNPNWKGGRSKNHYHYKKLQRQRYPERLNARNAVARAVKSRRLVKVPCPCGSLDVRAHHHKGYAREHWLDVVWLCRPCHRAEHGGTH